MSTLVKSRLYTSIMDGIYNDIITKNANYYYFVGRTNTWTPSEGATPGVDGIALPGQGLKEPTPIDTQKYELDTRNNIILYKAVKPSDISFVIPRIMWKYGEVYDMYDDALSFTNRAYSGATDLTTARFFVLTSANNVYKCISNNYDSKSTVEPSGTSIDEFRTADGYIWKFMYKIPSAVQHKFYTAEWMPVMTSLRDRFYQNGKILTVAVQDTGSGYSNETTLLVQGDGFLEENPYDLGHQAIIVDPGKGYVRSYSPTSIGWAAGVATATFSIQHNFKVNDSIIIFGSTPTGWNGTYIITEVVNPYSIKFNVLNFPGVYSGGATISKDIITISPPLWGGHKIQAKAYANISATGEITLVQLREHTNYLGQICYGYGYDNTATITVEPPFIEDAIWEPNTSYTLGKIIKAGLNFYEVTVAGTGNDTMPTHVSGAMLFNNLELTFIGRQAILSLVKTKTEAKMTPIIQNGAITGVTIEDGGIGYTYCNIFPIDVPPNESAILSADIAIGDVDTIQSNVELSAVDGSISYIKLERDALGLYKSGYGYGPDTYITIEGDGTGAAAYPVIENGSIKEIVLTNHGSGYNKDVKVNIHSKNGTGASARAILAPVGGHGKNAIHEFYASSLMLYSVLADERIFKIKNLNDYRQFGLIKNPRRYGNTTRYTGTSGTSCFLLIATEDISISKFKVDDEIYQSNGSKMRIILIDRNQLVVQTINTIEPTSGAVYNNHPLRYGESVIIKSKINPDVDKFSGDMLFIENKLAFVITASQVVAFRTIIGF